MLARVIVGLHRVKLAVVIPGVNLLKHFGSQIWKAVWWGRSSKLCTSSTRGIWAVAIKPWEALINLVSYQAHEGLN